MIASEPLQNMCHALMEGVVTVQVADLWNGGCLIEAPGRRYLIHGRDQFDDWLSLSTRYRRPPKVAPKTYKQMNNVITQV